MPECLVGCTEEWDSLFDVWSNHYMAYWHTTPRRSQDHKCIWQSLESILAGLYKQFLLTGSLTFFSFHVILLARTVKNSSIYIFTDVLISIATVWLTGSALRPRKVHVCLVDAHSSSLMQSTCFHLMNKLMRKVTSSYSACSLRTFSK